MRIALGPFVLLAAAGGALGHDMYLMPSTFFPQPGERIQVGFHVGDSFPDSEVGGRLHRLRDPRLAWESGGVALTQLRTEGNRDVGEAVVGGQGVVIAAASTQPTLIELAPDQFTHYLAEEGLTETIDWRKRHNEAAKPGKERYSKYAKALLLVGASNGFAAHKVGFIIEIIPEADPYSLKPGDALPIQVLFRNQPAADLQIEAAWASRAAGKSKITVVGRTDAQGRVRVPLPEAGLWRIHTIKMERCGDPQAADWESFWASLTFELR